MFSALTARLQVEVSVVNTVLASNDRARNLLFGVAPAPGGGDTGAGDQIAPDHIETLRAYISPLPEKLDWQIYDHCTAVTRLYAAYERFVNDLVSGYVSMLPMLYPLFSDLPESISVNHRIGIGQILVKIGSRKQYKDLEESAVIRALSSGLGSGTQYNLVPEAFLVERLNYRLGVIGKIFGNLGFDAATNRIVSHPAVAEFMRTTRGESDTAQGELESFVEYRNEAVHATPGEILSPDEIKKIGRFICAICEALADMVRDTAIQRHLQLGHSKTLGTITEMHYRGSIVVARMNACSVRVGEDLFICGEQFYRKATVTSLRLEDQEIQEAALQDGQELGIGFSVRARRGAELRILSLPEPTATAQMVPQPAPVQDNVEVSDALDASELPPDEPQEGV